MATPGGHALGFTKHRVHFLENCGLHPFDTAVLRSCGRARGPSSIEPRPRAASRSIYMKAMHTLWIGEFNLTGTALIIARAGSAERSSSKKRSSLSLKRRRLFALAA